MGTSMTDSTALFISALVFAGLGWWWIFGIVMLAVFMTTRWWE